MKQVEFQIEKDAFSGPFKCHGKETKLVSKQVVVDRNIFSYTAWQCPKCKKEYLDTAQAKRMECIWAVEKLLRDDVQTMRRSLNFDGKMFFMRFPKELTRQWTKNQYVDIKVIDNHRFVVEVRDEV